MLYRVITTEEVYYSLDVEADTEKEAIAKAEEAHTDGIDVEIDSQVTTTEVVER
jgi:hypothetical protein